MATSWPEAPRPSPEAVRRREEILEAAANADHAKVREFLADQDDRVRSTALVALADAGELDDEALKVACQEPSPIVRATVAQLAAEDSRVPLTILLNDDASEVVETACWAAGERGEDSVEAVPDLVRISSAHEDALCREAAVAALGAIGDQSGLPAILEALDDKATVRRRAVIALAPFDTPEVTAALERALQDRDWQVRQAAEDLLAASE